MPPELGRGYRNHPVDIPEPRHRFGLDGTHMSEGVIDPVAGEPCFGHQPNRADNQALGRPPTSAPPLPPPLSHVRPRCRRSSIITSNTLSSNVERPRRTERMSGPSRSFLMPKENRRLFLDSPLIVNVRISVMDLTIPIDAHKHPTLQFV